MVVPTRDRDLISSANPAEYELVKLAADNEKAAAAQSAAYAMDVFLKLEHQGYAGLERESVYGAAIAIPQIARSSGWSEEYVALTVRTYFFLSLNIVAQSLLLSYVGQSAKIMAPFGGQMHLCDFGANMAECPGDPNCRGPGGTELTPSRLYSYNLWSTRLFVRDSLQSLFPDRHHEIGANVDPGEYGLENYYCRSVCCCVFLLGVVNDLYCAVRLLHLLWVIPTRADMWVLPNKAEASDSINMPIFRVAGMPWAYKVSCFIFVFVPKAILWCCTTSLGFHFIMETAGIVDQVLGCMSMIFILSIDEMIMSNLTTSATKHIMDNIQFLATFETNPDGVSDGEVSSFSPSSLLSLKFWAVLFPKRAVLVVVLQVLFTAKYYWTACHLVNGAWVSNDMYLPMSVRASPINLMFETGVDKQKDPFWTMPDLD